MSKWLLVIVSSFVAARVFAQNEVDFMRLVRIANQEQMAAALAQNPDPNQVDRDGATPLMLAAACNPNPDTVGLLIEAGSKLGARNKDGVTALMYAADCNRNPLMIDALLKAGALIGDKDRDGETALIWAAKENDNPDVIAALVKAGSRLDDRDEYGMSPLIKAVRYNRSYSVIQALLAVGAQVNDKDRAKRTPLMYACESPDAVKLVPSLLAAGASVDDRDKEGMTALMWAAAKARNPAIVAMLLKDGASGSLKTSRGDTAYDCATANAELRGTAVCATLQTAQNFFEFVRSAAADQVTAALSRDAKAEDQDEDGWTPLMYAASRNPSPDVLGVLLKAGAKVDDRDPEGLTSLMLAARKSACPDVVAALLAAGADGRLKSAGKTAFDYAMTNGNLKGTAAYGSLQRAQSLCELARTGTVDMVTAAIAKGERADGSDEDQWTALMYAAESNPDPQVIGALVKSGASVDGKGPLGFTPLMLAARANRNPGVVMALLASGASGQVKSSDGKTPFDWASENPKIDKVAYRALERAQNFFEIVRSCSPSDVETAVKSGQSVNARDEQGWRPLMYAAQRNGDPGVVATLVGAGAKVDRSSMAVGRGKNARPRIFADSR